MVCSPGFTNSFNKQTLTTDIHRALLLSIGVSGFLLQVLLTEGLQREKAGRATNLIVSFLQTAETSNSYLTQAPVRSNGLRAHHRARRLGNHTSCNELCRQCPNHWGSHLGNVTEESTCGANKATGRGKKTLKLGCLQQQFCQHS